MEERLEKILEIKVDVGEAIKGIDSLNAAVAEQKKRQQELKEQIKQLEEAEGDNTDAIAEMREAYILSQQKVKDYNSQIQSLSKSVQNQLKIDRENIGSMQQLRAQLSNLTKAYDSLSAEEREAAKGQELKDKINEVTDALKNSEEATQRYYRNVGNYENAIKNTIGLNGKYGQTLQNVADATKDGITPALGVMKIALIAVGKQLLALMANPIVAMIAALAAAFLGAAKGIKSSEESMARFKAVTAAFKPIGDAVTNVFQAMGKALLSVVEWIGKGVGGFSRLLEKLPIVGDNIKAINEESRRYIQLEKDKQALVERNRKLLVDESNAELQVSELRVKAKEKELYTDQERLKFVQEANEIERKIAEEKKAVAEENLRLLKEETAATENIAEINDKLARAEADVNRATIEYNSKKRELLEQENTIKNEIAAKDKARADEAKRLNDEKIKQQKEYNDLLLSEMEKTQDLLAELIKDGTEKEEELERLRHERQMNYLGDMIEQYATDGKMLTEFLTQMQAEEQLHADTMARISEEAREKQIEDAEKAYEREVELQRLKLSAYSSISHSISALLNATAGDNIKRIKAAKIAALGEIAINQGIAIAQAVKAGGDYPFPTNLLTIASSVAGALAALVPAIQSVNSVRLARGGHVSGPGTSTSDSVPAMLSNGEFVVNARATSMFPDLLETINNFGLGIASPARLETAYQARQEAMTLDMMVKAFKQLPRPVVSVEEYSRVENRVDTLENLTRL